MFKWRDVGGLRLPWESRDSEKLQVFVDNTSMMCSCIAVLGDECIPMPTGVGHNNRLNDIELRSGFGLSGHLRLAVGLGVG